MKSMRLSCTLHCISMMAVTFNSNTLVARTAGRALPPIEPQQMKFAEPFTSFGLMQNISSYFSKTEVTWSS
jgi:hypothetical protein